MSLQSLIEQKAAIEAEIEKTRLESKSAAIAQVKKLSQDHGLGIADIEGKKLGKVAAKYRDAAGNTWTGRGQKPVWLRNVLAAGVPLDALRINR